RNDGPLNQRGRSRCGEREGEEEKKTSRSHEQAERMGRSLSARCRPARLRRHGEGGLPCVALGLRLEGNRLRPLAVGRRNGDLVYAFATGEDVPACRLVLESLAAVGSRP